MQNYWLDQDKVAIERKIDGDWAILDIRAKRIDDLQRTVDREIPLMVAAGWLMEGRPEVQWYPECKYDGLGDVMISVGSVRVTIGFSKRQD